jgi:hypothetical protein
MPRAIRSYSNRIGRDSKSCEFVDAVLAELLGVVQKVAALQGTHFKFATRDGGMLIEHRCRTLRHILFRAPVRHTAVDVTDARNAPYFQGTPAGSWLAAGMTRTHRRYLFPGHRSSCKCVSTNHSHLSMPRETSVNRSAVSRSPRSLASLMAFRAALPNVASAVDRAST